MKLYTVLNDWVRRWGWKLILVAMVVTTLTRAWVMWRQLPG